MPENSEAKKPNESQENSRAAVRSAVQASVQGGGTEAMQRGAAALEQAGRSAGETFERSGQAGAETMRHLSAAGARTAQRNAQGMIDVQQDFIAETAQQVEETIRGFSRTLAETARDWRDLMSLPRAGGAALQDVQRTMGHTAEAIMRTNLDAMREIFRTTSPMALAGLQQRFMRDYLAALLDGSTAVVRAVRQSAGQMLEPLERREAGNGGAHHGCVADVMERAVHVANPEDTVQQAARLMREEDTGALPVGEGDRLVGMVTDRDVAVRLAAEGRDPARTKVREVMSADVRYVFEDEDLGHVAENMAQQQVRRLPVMNRQRRLVGVVSLGDIAKGPDAGLAGSALRGVAREGGQHAQAAAE